MVKFPRTVTASERSTYVGNVTSKVEKHYLNFINELTSIYEKLGKKRVVVGICGPSGAGKSVFTAIVKNLADQMKLPYEIKIVNQDAFHHYNKYLLSHFYKGVPLKEYKGRYDTYDVAKFRRLLKLFRFGKMVSFPVYSRTIHEPIDNKIRITKPNALLLVEGIWLLYDKKPWTNFGKLFDYTFFITAEKSKVRDNVIRRHHKGGKSIADATAHFNRSDSVNFDLIMKTKSKANEILKPYYNIK